MFLIVSLQSNIYSDYDYEYDYVYDYAYGYGWYYDNFSGPGLREQGAPHRGRREVQGVDRLTRPGLRKI